MNQPEGLSFGWYLHVWLTLLRGDEPTFWHTMTPYRVMTLYQAHLRMTRPRALPREAPPKEEKVSLYAYVTGKGGS